MGAAKTLQYISVEEYLAGELVSEKKHEYSAGRVYAMAGGRNRHHIVATSFLVAMGVKLRGRPCQPFNSDTKVRLQLPTHDRFYYPDGMVVCDPNPQDDTYQDRPIVIAEVLSESTRRIDEGEKRDAYLTIPTLATYLLIETTSPRVIALERTNNGFVERLYEGVNAVIPLNPIGVSLSLSELYERVDFSQLSADEEEHAD